MNLYNKKMLLESLNIYPFNTVFLTVSKGAEYYLRQKKEMMGEKSGESGKIGLIFVKGWG